MTVTKKRGSHTVENVKQSHYCNRTLLFLLFFFSSSWLHSFGSQSRTKQAKREMKKLWRLMATHRFLSDWCVSQTLKITHLCEETGIVVTLQPTCMDKENESSKKLRTLTACRPGNAGDSVPRMIG